MSVGGPQPDIAHGPGSAGLAREWWRCVFCSGAGCLSCEGAAPCIGTLREHIEKALECLTDEFNAGRAGPSGLRAQAIAHVRYALLLIGDR